MKKKQIKFKKMEMTIFTLIVLIVTALIFVYGIVKLFFEKTDAGKSHLIFIICESLIMFGLILLPTIISKITKLMGTESNLEVRRRDNSISVTIFSDNN